MLKSALLLVLLTIAIAAAHALPELNTYGGWTGLGGKITGYFHVEEVDGKWWCIDPGGAVFFAIGTDHVNYNVHWCESLGYAPYAKNVRKKYKDDEAAWARSVTQRLKDWGFNVLGANNSPSTRGRGLSFMGFLGMGTAYADKDSIVEKVHWTGFPNVFNPAFVEFCEKKAEAECAPLKGESWLFGWFIDNELEWFGKNGTGSGIADEAIKRPAEHDAKKALVDLLKMKYADIGKFNAAWGTTLGSWDDALKSVAWQEHTTETVHKDKVEFVRLCADKYFSITTAAIRKADPNHMVLGCRFAGNAPRIWDIAGKYCDIVTLNYYGQVDLETLRPIKLVEDLTRWHQDSKRPLMITEWSFPALDAGLPCQHGAGMRVRTQADKAKCFEVYQKTFFSLPFVVGSDYFMWVDEPALGIHPNFPEDSNYGLVDVNDEPWKLFTSAVARVNTKAYDIHVGKTAELGIKDVKVRDTTSGTHLVAEIKNDGRVEANAQVGIQIDQTNYTGVTTVPPGETASFTMPWKASGDVCYLTAEVDPQGKLNEVDRGNNKVSRFVSKSPGHGDFGVFSPTGGNFTVTVPLSDIPGIPESGVQADKVRLIDAKGKEFKAEVMDLDGSGAISKADELVFQVELKPGMPVVYSLDMKGPSWAGISLVKPRKVDNFSIDTGAMKVSKQFPGGRAIDTIKLGDLEIGSFDALIQQVSGGTWWDRPEIVEGMRLWDGTAYKRVEVTVSRKPGLQVGSGPFGYDVTYAFSFYPEKQWFTAQFISLRNTDNRSWYLGGYFYHPQSSIGGSTSDDEVGLVGAAGMAAWIDKKAGGCYGLISPQSAGLHVIFWKDDAGNEHSDAKKPLDLRMAPGDTYSEPGVPVYLFCASTKDNPEPWRAVEQEIASQPKVEVLR